MLNIIPEINSKKNNDIFDSPKTKGNQKKEVKK
jgi:hypothetical protein